MKTEEIDLSELAREAVDADRGINLVTRPTGKQVRRRLEDRLEPVRDPTTFVLSFEHVDIIDYSCADEVFAKVTGRMKQGEYEDAFLLLDQMQESHIENVDIALEKKKLCLLGRANDQNGWTEIGKLDRYLKDVLDLIGKRRELTAKELAGELGLEHNTASTRLGNLHKARLVVRHHGPIEEGGRLYRYRTLPDAAGVC